MSIYALADLHLSGSVAKPMDIFGGRWCDHDRQIARGWRSVVTADDLVIIPGDISWAMKMPEAASDLAFIAGLPGSKLFVRGNHDYWWPSISRLRRALGKDMYALQNDYLLWDSWAVCGTRGWLCPGDDGFATEQDARIYRREAHRLRLSLEKAQADGHDALLVAMHFPPVNSKHEPSAFTALLEEYGVRLCAYGHLHGEAQQNALEGRRNGVCYRLVAADAVNFTPRLLVRGQPGKETGDA